MPRLTFSVRPDGLRLDVLIGHDATHVQALQAAGQPLPTPVGGRGILDTGSDVTCVVPSVLSALGLQPANRVRTHTAGGPVAVNLYDVSLTLIDPAGGTRTSFFRPLWTVMELPRNLPTVDVLVGMDLLNELVVMIDGPGKQFTLSF